MLSSSRGSLKAFIQNLPVMGPAARSLFRMLRPAQAFESGKYWEERYLKGGSAGAGSYNRLAAFKAEFLNDFARVNEVTSVIEFGCGDGNQLKLAVYRQYLGVDISQTAVALCKRIFADDATKTFRHSDEYRGERAEMSLSLDVIYHLVEDAVFNSYMRTLFECADRFVVIYASNDESRNVGQAEAHVRHRKFTDWVEANTQHWKLIERVPNRHPYDTNADPEQTSFADFYVYERRARRRIEL